VPVRAVFLDVGETLVDETRDWEAWADVLGVPRFTLLGMLGGVAARGEHHRSVLERLAPGVDLAAADAERRARGCSAATGPTTSTRTRCRACTRCTRPASASASPATQPAEVEAFLRALDAPVDVVASSASWGVEKPSRSSSCGSRWRRA
jgi:hypothetical protein